MTYTILYIVLVAIIAFVMAFFQYFYKPKNRNKENILLALLRGLAFFSILLLLINPKMKSKKLDNILPVLNVVLDNSASISYAKQQNAVKGLKDKINSNAQLNEKFIINYYSFSDDLYPLDSLSFDKTKTNISKTLKSLASVNNDRISPTVLISDGNQTFGSSYEFYNSNQPIYSVVVGDTIKHADIKIDQINVNSYAYLNNKFPVEVILQYDGNEKVRKIFTVKHNNKTVFTKYFDFSGEKKSYKTQFYLPATSVGRQNFKCDIATLNNEKNTINNLKNFSIEVLNEQAKILIISEINHPDISMIKRSIEMNKQRKVHLKTTLNENIQLKDYQLVIIYQPTSKFKNIFKKLEGINFFIITGTKTDWNFLNSAQKYFNKNSINKTENFSPRFNPNFDQFIIDDFGFDNFPPIEDFFGEIKFSVPNSSILFQKIDNVTTEEPLLATIAINNRRGAVLFGENIWRWRMLTNVENKSFEKFDSFINKLIQFLASKVRSNQLEIKYDSFIYSNSDVKIEAQYFDANYTFDPSASLLLSITNRTTLQLKKVPFALKKNSFKVSISNLKPGNYDFEVTVNNKAITKSGTLTVLPYEIEQQFTSANFNSLKQISQLSGGSYFHINKTDELFPLLQSDKRYKTIQRSTEKIVSLIERKWLLILVIFLLSLEWFIRKYKGLI